MQGAVGVVQPCEGVFLVILRAYRQQHTHVHMQLHILLKPGIYLTARKVFSYLYALNSVVADNTSPEGVVEVESKNFLVLSENSLDNCSKIRRDIRDSLHRKRVFIHIPLCSVVPLIEPVAGGNVVYVADMKKVVQVCVVCEEHVKAVHEAHTPACIGTVTVPEKPEGR